MLPGKTFKIEDVFTILKKRLWFILVPFGIVSAGTALVVRQWPDSYRSQTVIMVVAPRVPANVVAPTITTNLTDRLNAARQEILSRTNLTKIIEDFDLFASERRRGVLMEDVVDAMRRQIRVDALRGDAFMVAYIGDSPRQVQLVTQRLGTLFIEENERDREQLAEGTYQFLDAQLFDARRRLLDHEKLVLAFQDKYRGQLPTQVQSNLQSAQVAIGQLTQLTSSVADARLQKRAYEQQLKDLDEAPEADPVALANVDAAGNPTGGTAAQQLASAKALLAGLQQRYTDAHHDVIRVKSMIQELQAKADAEALTKPVAEAGLSPAEGARRKKVNDLKASIEQLDKQIEASLNEEKRLRTNATAFQARAEAGPSRDAEFTDLNRDYEVIKGSYLSLLRKKEDAQLAANLERRQIGEQFKLLDQAGLPGRPFSPNRPTITLLGMLAGLTLGVGLVGLRELRDGSFKTDDEVFRILNLPVLAVVPLMRSTAEQRRLFRRQIIVGAVCASTVVACLGVVAYTLVR